MSRERHVFEPLRMSCQLAFLSLFMYKSLFGQVGERKGWWAQARAEASSGVRQIRRGAENRERDRRVRAPLGLLQTEDAHQTRGERAALRGIAEDDRVGLDGKRDQDVPHEVVELVMRLLLGGSREEGRPRRGACSNAWDAQGESKSCCSLGEGAKLGDGVGAKGSHRVTGILLGCAALVHDLRGVGGPA